MLNLAIYLPSPYTSENPSIRLRRLSLRKILRNQGIICEVIHRFEDLWPYTNIQVSCTGEEAVKQYTQLKQQGKKLYFDHSEALFGLDFQKECFNLCDYIVCCSTKLAELTVGYVNKNTKVVVIPDIIENFEILPKHQPKETSIPKVVFCSMGGNAFIAKELEPLIKEAGMELVTINEWPDASISFKLDSYAQDMANCDIAICPQKVDLQPAKSNVKFSHALAMGLPTICSPLQAYLEIAEHNVNSLVANTKEDWLAAFKQLRDLSERQRLSNQAKKSVSDYTPEAISKRWFRLLKEPRRARIALINNTLHQKYQSYGDHWEDAFKLAHCEVDVFKYEDIHNLPNKGYDLYFFVEVRYDPEKINEKDSTLSCRPRMLYTMENPDLNHLPHFDVLITGRQDLFDYWNQRGFTNSELVENATHLQQVEKILNFKNKDYTARRVAHNVKLHSQHIEMFSHLLPPEARWNGGPGRDQQHIDFTLETLRNYNCKNVLDIGSADGWLSLKTAKESIPTFALESLTEVLHGLKNKQQDLEFLLIYVKDV